jgi:hypothetical protein
MATKIWLGGASTTAQVDTLTVGGTVESDDVFTVTLTAEDGTTAAVTVDGDDHGGNAASVVTALLAALQASTNALFTSVAWTSPTSTTIRGTAKVAGVPFYASVTTTEAGGGSADLQTFTRAATTANSGPSDFATAANWSGASVPVDGDDIIFQDSVWPVLYGLRQNALDPASVRRGESYRADVGDRVKGYQLILGSITDVFIRGSGGVFRLSGGKTNVYIEGTSSDNDAVVLQGVSTNIYISGTAVRGGIRLKANATVTNLDMHNVGPTARITVDSGNTAPTSLRMGGGRIDWAGSTITTLTQAGGYFVLDGSAAVTTANVYAGTLDDRSSGTITTLNTLGGTFTVKNNFAASQTITTINQVSGTTDLRNGLANITVTNNPTVRGGQLIADLGTTVDPKV